MDKLKTRPSELPRIALCPGSLLAVQGQQEYSSKWAERGTNAHVDIAELLENSTGDKELSPHHINEVFNHAPDPNYFMQVVTMAKAIKDEFYIDDDIESIEYEMSIPMWREELNTGHGDIVIVGQFEIDLIDIKTGRNLVPDPHENYQVLAYGIGLWDMYQKPVRVVIADWDGGFRSVHISDEDVNMYRDIIDRMINESLEPDGIRNPTPTGCLYCAAFATEKCKESKEIMEEIVRLNKETSEGRRDMALLLKFANAARNAGERAKKIFRSDAEAGVEMPDGVRVSKGRSTQFVSDNDKAIEALNNLGMEPSQISDCMSISTTKAKAVLMRDYGFDEPEAREKLMNALAGADALEEKQTLGSVSYRETGEQK
tara:strand:+ start:572 stop:1687 length:1116 start_codon:yes stop_codon:yes gene_type:complete